MPQDRNRELIGRIPGYEFRSAGKLCRLGSQVQAQIQGRGGMGERAH